MARQRQRHTGAGDGQTDQALFCCGMNYHPSILLQHYFLPFFIFVTDTAYLPGFSGYPCRSWFCIKEIVLPYVTMQCHANKFCATLWVLFFIWGFRH
jgi:hypothetical protein